MSRRFRDAASRGRSEICPYKPGESGRKRHKRRLKTNLGFEQEVRDFCAANEIELTITNNGHHWKFAKGNRLWEWWPSSAKCVTDKQWKRGVHVHDYTQVLQLISEAIEVHQLATEQST